MHDMSDLSDMNRETIWRAVNSLCEALTDYESTLKNYPHNYTELRDRVMAVFTMPRLLNDNEQKFMNWATERRLASGGYYNHNIETYGVVDGGTHPECYKSAIIALDLMSDDKELFDYIYDEYMIMQEAKKSQAIIDERNFRTCDKCGTRFDTYNGMARHHPRCKGVDRGEYHSKSVSGLTTSQW